MYAWFVTHLPLVVKVKFFKLFIRSEPHKYVSHYRWNWRTVKFLLSHWEPPFESADAVFLHDTASAVYDKTVNVIFKRAGDNLRFFKIFQ